MYACLFWGGIVHPAVLRKTCDRSQSLGLLLALQVRSLSLNQLFPFLDFRLKEVSTVIITQYGTFLAESCTFPLWSSK